MTVRTKTLLVVGGTLLVLIGALYLVGARVLLAGFRDIERAAMERDVARVADALQAEINGLAAKANDWAVWDDSYQFMADGNPAFIQSNCGDVTFADLRLNLLVFARPTGEIVFQKGFDGAARQAAPVPASFQPWLTPPSPLLEHDGEDSVRAGLLVLPEGPLLVAARPIVTSNRQGPIRGTVVFGRYLDDELVARLAALTHVTLGVERLTAAAAEAAVPRAIDVRALDARMLSGETVVADLRGRPALRLRVTSERAVYAQGWRTVRYLGVSLLVVCVAAGLLLRLLLHRLLLRRLDELVRQVDLVGRGGDHSRRLPVAGRDELAALATAINRMLAELQESEELFRSLSASSPTGVFLADLQGQFTYVNPRYRDMFGLSLPECLARGLAAWVAPAELPSLRERWQHCLDHDETCEGEFFSPVAGKWLHVQGRRLPAENRAIQGVVGTVADITARRVAEDALRREKERAADYLDVAGVMLLALDADGRVALINRKGCELLQCPERDVLGKNWFDHFIPAAQRAEVRAAFEQLMAGRAEHVEYHENPIWTATGETRLIAWHNALLRDATGRITGTLSSGEDITRQRRMEQEQARLVAILEATTDIVAMFTPSGHGRYVNAAGRRALGIGADETVTGLQVTEFVAPAARELVLTRAIPAALRDGVWTGEVMLRRRDGHEFPVSVVGVAHRDATGAADLLSVIARDLSSQRQLELQLRQSQKMEAIGQLAGGVAHDFNNLLQVIIGFADLALLKLAVESAPAAHVREVKKAGERAAGLTRQLLAFSRKQLRAPKRLDLNVLLGDLTQMLRRLIPENITLTIVPGPGLGLVYADPGQIEQVIVNLVVNARDAMPRGGSLTIQTENVVDAALRSGNQEHKAWVRLSVTDTGVGMSAAVQAHLFEPFFTTKPAGRGTGLGLATCYGIVQQNEGRITVESEEGRGSTFRVDLPRLAAAAAAAPAAEMEAALPRGTETILLVEDEPALLELAALVLRDLGYTVLTAGDGEAAAPTARGHQGRIDLLVTDVVMPKRSGKELADLLRVEHPRLKVLFMSGYTQDAVSHAGVLDAGVNFLQKPFPTTTIAHTVRAVLDS